ncbi:MAG TPA: N-acetyltransferase [Rhizomicrobium sp.]|jgi:predicted N-acetyltransferase YhbS|nr:N-acetyltransferase [Rhizomicrobium sp.]
MSWEIRPERADDAPLVEALVAASFGPGRFAKSAYRLRDGVAPEAGLSFVAIEDSILRGSVRFWPVFVGRDAALLLGPLAVQSDQRGRGIGIALMQKGIADAKKTKYRAVILVGDEPYYARVGFTAIKPGKVKFFGPVNPARILGLALADGALETLEGQVRRARIDEPVCADGAPLGGQA